MNIFLIVALIRYFRGLDEVPLAKIQTEFPTENYAPIAIITIL